MMNNDGARCGFFDHASHFCVLADEIAGKRVGRLCKEDCMNVLRELAHDPLIKELLKPLEESMDKEKKGTTVLKSIRKAIIMTLFKYGYQKNDIQKIFEMNDGLIRQYEKEFKAREIVKT